MKTEDAEQVDVYEALGQALGGVLGIENVEVAI